MEAHNGLSARIVEEAGFKGVWASGLSISAALGVRDNNEASWTQVLEVVEFMADATTVPILLDGDTGFGNFNNVRRLVKKLEQRGVAAVCIEDKLFPKTNSFINGERQPLADIDEFCGKIKAVKDAQTDPDFCLVARLEGFIAGWGIEEMLRRANSYHRSGADALLIHSKKSTPQEILQFADEWGNRCPLVIVPTMYYSTPSEVFEQAGISIAIWANHNVRASITAMQQTCRTIFNERSVRSLEDTIASVKEVFRLQNAQELILAEERYLPRSNYSTRAIILAASQGNLGALTDARPKAMVPINGHPLLHKLVAQFRAEQLRDIVIIRGFGAQSIDIPDVNYVDNPDFANTYELYSLNKAADSLSGNIILSFGDILFRRYILQNLLAHPGDIVLAVDAAWRDRARNDQYRDYISASLPYSTEYSEEEPVMRDIGPDLDQVSKIDGEWIGLLKATASGTEKIRTALDRLKSRADFKSLRCDALLRELTAAGETISIVYITGHWLDVDNLEDLSSANAFNESVTNK